MAIPWLTVLQIVPWREVVNNAPKVAEGARKLWNTIGKQAPVAAMEAPDTRATPGPNPHSTAQLQTRLAAVEVALDDLHAQMLASSELIKALADQNTQLVKRIEANRIRVFWLAGLMIVIGAVAWFY